jgi:hypothetical protein
MTVTTETPMATVTPIFDELAERLGLVWDVDSTEVDSTEESVEEPAETDTEAAVG